MSKTLATFRKILEYLWLAISIAAVIIGIRELIVNTFNQALPFFIFAFVGLFFFSSRRNQRLKKEEKSV